MSDEETEAVAAEDVDEPQDDDEEVGTDATAEPESAETDGADAADDASDAGDDGDDGGDGDADGLQDGDFIELSYTAYTVEDGQLVDTTSQEVAEEEGVGDQGNFEPRTIILGAGHLFDVVEDAIIGHDVGHSDTVVVPAAEAFGEYDQEEVRTVSADKIDEDDRYPGAQIQIDGEQGYLETIIGGRARVDFNHPLAGDDIEYEFEVLDVVEDPLEQARGLLNMFLDMDLEMHIETDEVEEERLVEPDEDDADADEDAEDDASDTDAADAEADDDADESEGEDESDDGDKEPEPEFETVTVEKETLYIEATPQLSFNQQWLFQKQQIAQEIIDRVGLDRIVIEEVIDGSGGMPGMMGGMGGMMGGAGGAAPEGEELEEALEDADVDEEEILEELDADLDEE